LRLMHEEKVKIVIGLDAGENFSIPGFAMIEEMKLLKEAGFNNYEVLECATVNAAECLDRTGRFGTIESGKNAELVFLKENPLDNLSTISEPIGVFMGMRYYDHEVLKGTLSRP
ncbi:MAG TPA: amidohydrolase family protein, partial [Dyadobacter sp.]|nr:amidohydrolase family protein [Dyadobacter sp.]